MINKKAFGAENEEVMQNLRLSQKYEAAFFIFSF